ncbi:hypothetical protein [Rhizorhabdus dicambivorans]|uniref:Uncharacterized protein n=1 Tax=Rhizorhabdus dicambivorans TaxID=1850238 RepID=A0A2A4FY22_9SPHN|nr:hypothetical protein [Rhizorhabdus dicambivorans]ATE63465.1 hypothetical protein CMV14_02805 [Rhizorhabdus dicambivorans]PCE43684.1 hypothetical protein COO09_05125 [Rhizorhabdus dicambivorans]
MVDEVEDLPDDPSILDDDLLLRRVHPIQIKADGTFDRSIFRNDTGGYGTSLTVWRSDADMAAIATGHDEKAIVAIKASELRKHGLKLAFTYEEGNPNHCEAIGHRTKGMMGQMRDASQKVRDPL